MAIQDFLYKFDILSQSHFLKINRQKAYKTKIGGVLTIIFVLFILGIFTTRLALRS